MKQTRIKDVVPDSTISPMISGIIEKTWNTEFTKEGKVKQIYHFKLVRDERDFSSFESLMDNESKDDIIYFKFKTKGGYFNIYSTYKVDKLGTEPTNEEINSQQPEVKACQGGGETSPSGVKSLETKADEVSGTASRNPPADLDSNHVIILRCAVDLCIKRNDLSDEAIKTCFTRLLILANEHN